MNFTLFRIYILTPVSASCICAGRFPAWKHFRDTPRISTPPLPHPCHTSSGTAAGRQRQSFTDAAAGGMLSGKQREDPSRLPPKKDISGVVPSCSAWPPRCVTMIYACASAAVVEQDVGPGMRKWYGMFLYKMLMRC